MKNLVTFKYAKTPEDISTRIAFILSEPSEAFLTLEVAESDDDRLEQVEKELLVLKTRQRKEVDEFRVKYGLSWKSFSKAKIISMEEL